MQQFIAILKDSFREAVDGFVIYVMLALAVVVAVIVGSVSFTPDSADAALPAALKKFHLVFPDRGKSAAFTAVSDKPIEYRADKCEQSADGTVRCTLNVKSREEERFSDGPGNGAKYDLFRYSVFTWSKPAGEKLKNPFAQNKGKDDDRKIEIVTPPEATPGDLRGVSDEDMIGFLKTQFGVFIGIPESNVTIRRVTTGVAEPEYQFDVELKGATTARGWSQTLGLFFNQASLGEGWKLGETVHKIETWLVGWIGGTATLVISVVITAFFIPNMLRKGSLDLLISKPIGRSQLIVYKYVGGLTFIFLITSFTIGLVWVALSARAGYWDPTFLVVIPSLTFTFAILYAVSLTIAVFTRSAIASILLTIAFMFFLFLIGTVKSFLDANKVFKIAQVSDWVYTVVDAINAILPRYKDLDRLTSKLLVETNLPVGDARLSGLGLIEYPSWGGTIGVSVAFIAVMLALSCWRLNKRDN